MTVKAKTVKATSRRDKTEKKRKTSKTSPKAARKTVKRKPEAAEQPVRKTTRREALAVEIGSPKLTKYERARIIGARALQLSLGAPPFVSLGENDRDPITIATKELSTRALPISIRRSLPDGRYKDIPLQALL
ncbi:MAG: DNA-directed RNA polymerase subunit K [Thaumarchaeota archaeon]|nr:DNA-directed RNA polymerase subunit K [Nitrososphaerota archaeon]